MNKIVFVLFAMLLALFVSDVAIAGAVGGPRTAQDTVSARSSDQFFITFDAGQPARVVINGDGSTDFDCQVFDNGGHLVDSDTGPSDDCFLAFQPRWTGKFRIVVINLGNIDNEYRLQTN